MLPTERPAPRNGSLTAVPGPKTAAGPGANDHDLARLVAALDAGTIAPRVAARLIGFLALERARPGAAGFPERTFQRHVRQLRELGCRTDELRW